MRLHIPIPLRWGDLDAFDHVNNATMLRLLEEARIRAFWLPNRGEDAPSTAVLESGRNTATLTLVARQEIEYLAPVPYQRHPLDVQMWFGRLGGSSVDVCYDVCSPREQAGEQTVYARAQTVVVKVDSTTGRPARMTDAERAAWQPYVEPPIVFSRRPERPERSPAP